jgi:hypothetical protein
MSDLREPFGVVDKNNKDSRLMIVFLMLFFTCLFVLPAEAQYGGGTGEPNDPYLIYTAEQMNEIGAGPNDWDKHFKLMADIDLSAYKGTDFNIIGTSSTNAFSGVFEGNNHKISNFIYSSTKGNYIGIFGYLKGSEVKIRNLGLIDPNVDTGSRLYAGPLVSFAENGTFTNCYVKGGSVSGAYQIGGLIGCSRAGTITNCYTEGVNISGGRGAGGLVGRNNAEIEDCYSACSVSGNNYVGGLVGDNGGDITNSYATGMVSADGNDVGGLIGGNGHPVTNCYALGAVLGNGDVGGLIGTNSSHVANCSAAGDVLGSRNVGGLVGSYSGSHGSISNSCSTGNVSGENNVGGFVGNCGGTVTTVFSDDDTVTRCCATGSVSGVQNVGGLIGINCPNIDGWGVNSKITCCYSTGSVSGVQNVGGLVGANSPSLAYPGCIASIAECYSTSSVTGTTDVGGLLGLHKDGVISTSFWDIQTSGLNNMCGRKDPGSGCDDSKGKTRTEMQTESTFLNAGWDFANESVNGDEDIWIIREGQDYPKLLSQFVIAATIDDFEDYNAGDNQIWFSWHDGLGAGMPGTPGYLPGNGTGSAVGDETSPSYTEETIVHDGNQSMPYSYNNSFNFSKAELLLSPAQDWTEKGICMLSLWFHGVWYNPPAPMSVVLNGDYAVYHDNPNATRIDAWTRWTIDLQEFTGMDLTNVNSIAICFGDQNGPKGSGSGTVYFDDIYLYKPGCK